MKNLVLNPVSWVIAGVFGLMMFFGGAELFADDPAGSAVTFTPIVSFDNIFDSIRTGLTAIVAGALGLGLAIWGARYVFSVIKSMGR